jgi:hypothetical protein
LSGRREFSAAADAITSPCLRSFDDGPGFARLSNPGEAGSDRFDYSFAISHQCAASRWRWFCNSKAED